MSYKRPIANRSLEAQSPPELHFNVPSSSGTYIAIGLDIDAPFPQSGFLGPILHWIQPGLKATPSADGTPQLESSEPFVANYIGPAPPPFGGPHRYIFFLYEQPTEFDGKKYAPPEGKTLGNFKRMWYDLDAFEKEVKLGPALAVNYFRSN
jgi:phosphatidylethanolamine-binding protein